MLKLPSPPSIGQLFLLSCAMGLVSSFALSQEADPDATSSAPGILLPCPDLSTLMPGAGTDWQSLRLQLSLLMPRCLQDANYYALLGAAQLNTGRLADAFESLERALLLDPDNGAAQVDYAEALFQQGQLFPALELNKQISKRPDVPDHLQDMLSRRHQAWRSLTRQWTRQADVLAGYDSNLNGAPSPTQITLTLSGESVDMPLSPDLHAVEGPYLNMRLGARYRQLAPNHQHNLLLEMRGRVSEDTASDLLQLDTRYAFIKPGRRHSLQLLGGMSHLFFGGSPLYSATELGGSYQFSKTVITHVAGICNPYANAVAQHQLFYNQSYLNAVEGKLSAGLVCQIDSSLGRQQLIPQLSVLSNNAIRNTDTLRAGGNRLGWQASMEWQIELPAGMLTAQINHTQMRDNKGYSPLLADGARRQITRSYVLMQYRQVLSSQLNLIMNIYHQKQHSNLELFSSDDNSFEIGLNFFF